MKVIVGRFLDVVDEFERALIRAALHATEVGNDARAYLFIAAAQRLARRTVRTPDVTIKPAPCDLSRAIRRTFFRRSARVR